VWNEHERGFHRGEELCPGGGGAAGEGGYKSGRMVRVIHLVGGAADFQTARALEALTRSIGDEFHVTVERAGGVAREALRGRRRGVGDAGVVQAWGGAALAAAVLRGRGPIVFSPAEFPSRRALRWLRAAMGYRDIHVVCSTATQRRVMVEGGVPLERCHLVRPGVDFSKVRRRRDPALRKRLGFGEGDYVLLAPGESTRAAAHEDAVWAGAIAHYLEPTVRMLVWGRGERAGAVDHILRSLKPGGIFAFWENNPWNPGTRYIMSRIPFDKDAVMLTPPEARRLLERGGFEVLRTDYLFIFPNALRLLRALEPPLSPLPLGAQYQILCRKP